MSIESPASKNKTPGFRPGVSVKNGKLYAFSEVRVLVVRGWPEMSAWTRTFRRPQWSQLRPEIDFWRGIIDPVRSRHLSGRFPLIAPVRVIYEPLKGTNQNGSPAIGPDRFREATYERQQRLVSSYFANVPAEVREAIAPFGTCQWHLHVMAARCPGALDLLLSNPALAYCVASCWVFTGRPSKFATQFMLDLIGSRRRDICRSLGFAASSVSVLSKIPAFGCTAAVLLIIRRLLNDPDWRKMLWHLPSLSPAVTDFLVCEPFRRRATPRLLHEIAENETSLFLDMLDILVMEDELGEYGNVRFESISHFHRTLRKLRRRTHRPEPLKEPEPVKYQFPTPPIPGISSIVPLGTPDLLNEEGRVQSNCAAAYNFEVTHGIKYLYRVLEPERATLSIVPNENGRWRIDQLLRAHNQPVSDETYQAVARWLSQTPGIALLS